MNGPVHITHAFHPQCGLEIEVVGRRDQWGEDRVFYKSAHGHLASLPARWTSLVADDAPGLMEGERPLFRLEDLLELSELVAGLKR